MSRLQFDQFFQAATGNSPYEYQCRIACGDVARSDNPETLLLGCECRSLLVNVPTGLGKTAAVTLAWLWNRLGFAVKRQPTSTNPLPWPRRLVYCLPMRTLVEQTERELAKWLTNLWNKADWLGLGQDSKQKLEWLLNHSPIVLMGGEELAAEKENWDIHPERPAILIGTQDMLLSRALNRGYGMSRYRWPMHFGLLNNDCLWVFDEVQLMGSGLATTAQLEAFRTRLGQNGCASLWMSATLQRDWLKTVDFADPEALPLVQLNDHDLRKEEVRQRRGARKPVQPATAHMDNSNGLATEIFKAHERAGGRTLAIMNTVARARDLVQQLQGVAKFAESKPELVLIHSRFRPDDRRRQVDRLLAEPGKGGTIVVSTQVVEAGVDISATTLFTELAPWASLVQRFGRCNRRGTENDKAQVFWIDLPADDKQYAKFSAPYETDGVVKSREILRQCQDVGPASLAQVNVIQPYRHGHVLRHKDFIELFDTTPDLAGNDIDIQRYVREIEECNVQVFWRKWAADQPPEDMGGPRREELCAVPVGEFREFARDKQHRSLAFRWDDLDEAWVRVELNRIFPGQIYMLHAEAGGYTRVFGWYMRSSESVVVLAPQDTAPPEPYDADLLSQFAWQSVAEHTEWVCHKLEAILSQLEITEAVSLQLAARWHDRGKAHFSFQAKLKSEVVATAQAANLLHGGSPAKAPHDAWVKGRNRNTHYRRHFRHELASGIAVLMARNDQVAADVRDIVAYLVAAHHGKVRLSIRSLPEELVPPGNRRFARGVWQEDKLPVTHLGGNVIAEAIELSLEPMELGLCEQPPFAGQPSWADRMLRLRDKLGPCRLAYLEAILRAADMRASMMKTPAEVNHA